MIFYQLLPTTSTVNEYGRQMRILILTLGFKGLRRNHKLNLEHDMVIIIVTLANTFRRSSFILMSGTARFNSPRADIMMQSSITAKKVSMSGKIY